MSDPFITVGLLDAGRKRFSVQVFIDAEDSGHGRGIHVFGMEFSQPLSPDRARRLADLLMQAADRCEASAADLEQDALPLEVATC